MSVQAQLKCQASVWCWYLRNWTERLEIKADEWRCGVLGEFWSRLRKGKEAVFAFVLSLAPDLNSYLSLKWLYCLLFSLLYFVRFMSVALSRNSLCRSSQTQTQTSASPVLGLNASITVPGFKSQESISTLATKTAPRLFPFVLPLLCLLYSIYSA